MSLEILTETAANFRKGESAERYLCDLLQLQSCPAWTDRFDATDESGNKYEIKSCRVRLPNKNSYRYRRGSFKLHEKDLHNDKDTRLLFALEYSDGHIQYLGLLTLEEYKQRFGMAKSVSWLRISDYIYLRDKKSETLPEPQKIEGTRQASLEEFL